MFAGVAGSSRDFLSLNRIASLSVLNGMMLSICAGSRLSHEGDESEAPPSLSSDCSSMGVVFSSLDRMNYLPCSNSSFLKKRRQLSAAPTAGKPVCSPFTEDESFPSFED